MMLSLWELVSSRFNKESWEKKARDKPEKLKGRKLFIVSRDTDQGDRLMKEILRFLTAP